MELTLTAIEKQLETALAIQCYRSFHSFFLVFWEVIEPTMPLMENWHIKYLCDEAQEIVCRVAARENKLHDLIVSISPGETKSTIFSRMLPAWAWLRDPSLKIISGSYDYSLATSFTVKSRDIILSEQYKKIQATLTQLKSHPRFAQELNAYRPFKMKGDQNVKSFYESDCGGLRIASSPNSRITGFHADLIIVDDSVKPPSPKQGLGISYTEILAAINWVGKVLSSRKTNRKKTPTIYVQQRVAKKDVTAHLLSTLPAVKHIRLPATSAHPIEPPELRAFYNHNGYMNPFTTDEDVIKEKTLQMTPAGWMAQFEQNPDDDAGSIWQAEWFGKFSMADLPDGVIWHTVTDTASTDNEANSASGMLCYAYIDGIFYIRRFKAVYEQADGLAYEYIKFHAETGYDPALSKAEVEPKANGISFAQLMRNDSIVALSVSELKRKGINASHIKRINTKAFDNILIGEPGTDRKQQVRWLSMGKSDKALHVANTIRSGKVKLLQESELPTGETWADFLEAAQDFPATALTEVIDTVSYMIISNETVSASAIFPRVSTGSYGNYYRQDIPIHLFWAIEPTIGRFRCIVAQMVQHSPGNAYLCIYDEFEGSDLKSVSAELLDVYANQQQPAQHYHIMQPSPEHTQMLEIFSPRFQPFIDFGCKFQSVFHFTGKATQLQTIQRSGGKQKVIEQISARANAVRVLLSGGYQLKTTQMAGSKIQLVIDNNCTRLADSVRSLLKDFDNVERYGDWVNNLCLGVQKMLENERDLFRY